MTATTIDQNNNTSSSRSPAGDSQAPTLLMADTSKPIVASRSSSQIITSATATATAALSTPTLSTSPKAKSAPATPCNVTPTAVDQHSYYLNSLALNPNPANTLPSDIRRNISATCRKLPSSIGLATTITANSSNDAGSGSTTLLNGAGAGAESGNGISRINLKHHMDELIKRGDSLLNSKDYKAAVYLYTQWIELANSQNFLHSEESCRVYSQRAEAYFSLGDYEASADDSMAARDLNPKWTQAYYRQGKAQFLLKLHLDSLAVFAFGLAQDSSNLLLFEAFVEAALKSNLFKKDFEPKFNKLKSLHMDKDPFVVVSVLGQDVLAKGHDDYATVILESALKIGTDKRRLLGSVLSTISYAYCVRREFDKAIIYMKTELEIEEEVLDVTGQCRVLGNIGYTYYKMRKYDLSLEAHRKQVNRAMRAKLFEQVSTALNAIGHIHVARGDFSSALTSHSRCLEILKQLGDNNFSQYQEILSIGYMHSMLGDYEATEKKYNEAIELLELSNRTNKIKPEDYLVGLTMVHFNLAYLALKKQLFCEANSRYTQVIEISKRLQDRKLGFLIEMRASNGLGQTHRLFKEFDRAKTYFERQLELARLLEDLVGQSQALCNLGMIYQHFKDYNLALEKFDENLRLVDKADPLLKAYAHSYMASMYFLFNKYNEAQAQYEISLRLFKELDYCMSEKKTIDLNMAAVYERMGHSDLSLTRMTHNKLMMSNA